MKQKSGREGLHGCIKLPVVTSLPARVFLGKGRRFGPTLLLGAGARRGSVPCSCSRLSCKAASTPRQEPQPSQRPEGPKLPTPPCHPAQRALPSSVPPAPAPQLLPSPGTRLGLRLPGAGPGLPRWQLQGGRMGTLNQGGFPCWCWQPCRLRAPAASSAHSSLLYLPAPSSPRPTAPAVSLVSRAGSGTGPFLTSQANKAADPLHFPSSAMVSPSFPRPLVS